MNSEFEWLSLNDAVVRFGYSHKNSLTKRIRQLRQQGLVVDIGNAPEKYNPQSETPEDSGKLVMFWLHSKTALIRSDASLELLHAKKGKPLKKRK